MITKKEIVKRISEETRLTQVDTKVVVQKTLDAIIGSLVEHGRIELRNFGVFEVKRREPRKARNPRTGKEVFVEAKHVVTFKPGKVMQDLVSSRDFSGVDLESYTGSDAGDDDDDLGSTEIRSQLDLPENNG